MKAITFKRKKLFGKKKTVSFIMAMLMLFSSVISPMYMSFSAFAKGEEMLSEYLELQYEFENADNMGKDSGEKKNNGKICGNISQIEGIRGKAAFFNSENHSNSEAYIEMPINAVKHNELTIMAWVKYDISTVGSYARIFAIEAGSGRAFHLMANSGSGHTGYKAEFFGGNPSSASIVTEGLIPSVKYNDWHHVSLSYDGKELKLFVDGAYVLGTKVSAGISAWNISKAFLGKTALWGDGTYNGCFDDVRVYSKALTEEEISSINDFSPKDYTRGIKLLSSLSISGEQLTEFNAFAEDYYRVLPEGTTEIPTVTADPPYSDSTIEVVPADKLPGETKINITYSDGSKRTVSVKFVFSDADLKLPELGDVIIDDEFWNGKLKMFCEVTAPYVLRTWVSNTHDDLRNFDKVAAGNRNTGNYVGGMTWGESDFYAAMAGSCRLLIQYPNEALKKQILSYVDRIYAASESVETGYFSIYNLLMTNGKVFGEAENPAAAADLFNLGYLIEFGIALYQATGDARILRAALRFLNFTVKYSNHGAKNFVSFHTGAEYNIIALCEFLEEHTEVLENEYIKELEVNTDDYSELAGHLLSYRGVFSEPSRVNGKTFGSYSNDHIPYEQLRTATGHSVVALLYYFALSEMGRTSNDLSYVNAAYRLWENTVNKQMYIIGGVGSVHAFEGFGGDYYLPNEAYSESCTSGALVQFSSSLSLMFADSKYQDNIELALYNNLLGSIGADGKSFFYQNPLSTNTSSRWSWHGCPCCTKYGLMIYGDLPKYIYSYSDDSIFVNQYIGSNAKFTLKDGKTVIKQNAEWAKNGTASIVVGEGADAIKKICLRIPDWSDDVKFFLNGKEISPEIIGGYAYIYGNFTDGDTLKIVAEIKAERIYSNENVAANIGRTAIRRGPVIYCMEGLDNKTDFNGEAAPYIVLPESVEFSEALIESLYGGVISLSAKAKLMIDEDDYKDYTIKMVPFYARSNRGASSVYVWLADNESTITAYPAKLGSSTELKTFGAKYTALTNAVNPQGGGSKNINVIVDGKAQYSKDSEQYDTFRAMLNDSLGKQGTLWFGVRMNKEYPVTHVVFWEGGHWSDGGWFGSSPLVQILKDNEWVDVEYEISPVYPGNSQAEQLPVNQAYTFTLLNAEICSGVRVLGKMNNLAGHASCSEIEIYGYEKASDIESDESNTASSDIVSTEIDSQSTSDSVSPEKKPLKKVIWAICGILAVIVGGVTAVAVKKKSK